jgi:hypothetical protein
LTPGDIAITRTQNAYMVASRNVTCDGLAPWWHYFAVISTFEDAVCFARALAERDGVRAWVRTSEKDYELLRDQDSISYLT